MGVDEGREYSWSKVLYWEAGRRMYRIARKAKRYACKEDVESVRLQYIFHLESFLRRGRIRPSAYLCSHSWYGTR